MKNKELQQLLSDYYDYTTFFSDHKDATCLVGKINELEGLWHRVNASLENNTSLTSAELAELEEITRIMEKEMNINP